MCDELREKGATEQRATYHRDIVLPHRIGKLRHKRLDSSRVREERIEIEPERPMVARLEQEVSAPPRHQCKEVGCGGARHGLRLLERTQVPT